MTDSRTQATGGRFAGLAEQVESALGLEPLPEPADEDSS